ncbi:MAG: 30S ribosomal protein S8 [Metamycoplasmataceae bacterium]
MSFITDPIADMIVRIKNANQRKFKSVNIPHSKVKVKFLEILEKEGFISSFEIETHSEFKKEIIVNLKYKSLNRNVITDIKRISKPGLRIYVDVESIPSVLSGFGIAIISTSKGMMTDKEARKENIGGEVLAYVW